MSSTASDAGVSYVVPLRWTRPGPIGELASYLRSISAEVDEVLVVDGSPPPFFERHAEVLDGTVRHLRPHPELAFAMGKVNGVATGVRESSHEYVVLADDDVRYDAATLRRTVALLSRADLVRPQNYFDEWPWHARWDAARTLLNRVFTGDRDFPVGDFPGTLALRRGRFLATGGYDGDALFENLELMRTVLASGGRVVTPLHLYVARRPPSTAHFLSQRVRQAYDDFAIPVRLGFFLTILPWTVRRAARRERGRLAVAAAAAMATAELGRRRVGGAEHFPASASLLAPAWLSERAVCAWLALAARLRGGVRYGDGRLRRSATSMRRLRRRYAAAGGSPDGGAPDGGAPTPLSARKRVAL